MRSQGFLSSSEKGDVCLTCKLFAIHHFLINCSKCLEEAIVIAFDDLEVVLACSVEVLPPLAMKPTFQFI